MPPAEDADIQGPTGICTCILRSRALPGRAKACPSDPETKALQDGDGENTESPLGSGDFGFAGTFGHGRDTRQIFALDSPSWEEASSVSGRRWCRCPHSSGSHLQVQRRAPSRAYISSPANATPRYAHLSRQSVSGSWPPLLDGDLDGAPSMSVDPGDGTQDTSTPRNTATISAPPPAV